MIHISHQLFIISPSSINKDSLKELQKRYSLLYQLSTGSLESFSEFIGAQIIIISKDEYEKQKDTFHLSIPLNDTNFIFVSKTEKISDIEKEFISNYAKFYEELLKKQNQQKEQTEVSQIEDFFDVVGFNHFFNCSKEESTAFFSNTSLFFSSHGIELKNRIPALNFTQDLLNDKAWSHWFSSEQRLVIYLLVLLQNLPKYFAFTCDENLENLISGKNAASHPYIALLFGVGSQITKNLTPEKKETLINLLHLFSFEENITEISRIYGNVRIISSKTFQTLNDLNPYIAKAVILISHLFIFLSPANEIMDILTKAYGQNETKQILYLCDRMLLPILTFMSQKNHIALNILNIARTSLRELKKVN